MQSVPATPTPTSRVRRPSSIAPSNSPTQIKKYKAPLSADTRTRSTPSKAGIGGLVTPTKRIPPEGYTYGRPKTPSRQKTSSRAGTPGPREDPELSEWDVSRVDPEEALVDWQTVEAADVSLDRLELELGQKKNKDDKVLVSIRVKPTDATPAWKLSGKTIRLDPKNASGKPVQDFTFDHLLTGSQNKPVYTAVARNHVIAAMEGYNAVVFAYGQTASGKTFTLSGDEDQPGIIPRALRDIFGYIRQTPSREYLLRCSYLEIYNENIHDLLAPPSISTAQPVMIHGTPPNIILSPLREEVVTSLKGCKAVLERGERNRRTASTDWNARSSRSHSVFRVVIESRERDEARDRSGGRTTPGGRQTPGPRPPTPGGARLQAIGGRTVQTSTLSLIDLAGSEKATSDKERTREGKFINTSLLTLGTVISTLAENAAKNKRDHVPFRNSKLTRLLQPSLSGNALISVICTLNPGTAYLAETISTLGFATRVRGVKLNATKKEVVDTEALLEVYRKEIEELRTRLKEREEVVERGASGSGVRGEDEGEGAPLQRRLSAREQLDESKAMRDLNARIRQLTKLILTSSTIDPLDPSRPGSPLKFSRPSSPVKGIFANSGNGPSSAGVGEDPEKRVREGELEWGMSQLELQQALLSARREIESQSVQILSLEAALAVKSKADGEKDEDEGEGEGEGRMVDSADEDACLVVKANGDAGNQGRSEGKDTMAEQWRDKYEKEKKSREESEAWASELTRQLERERKARMKLEEERQALVAFVHKFDSLSLGGGDTSTSLGLGRPPSRARVSLSKPKPKPALTVTATASPSPSVAANAESLLEEKWPWGADGDGETSLDGSTAAGAKLSVSRGRTSLVGGREKENVPVS